MTGPAGRTASTRSAPLWNAEEFARLMYRLATDQAPRLFAIVEEYGEAEDARVAGYGLAYEGRADVNSVEGDFVLNSPSPEAARALFEVSSRSAGVRRVHVVWLDEAASAGCPAIRSPEVSLA
ncbi:hypothetical protein [Saccharothrix stipae]